MPDKFYTGVKVMIALLGGVATGLSLLLIYILFFGVH